MSAFQDGCFTQIRKKKIDGRIANDQDIVLFFEDGCSVKKVSVRQENKWEQNGCFFREQSETKKDDMK